MSIRSMVNRRLHYAAMRVVVVVAVVRLGHAPSGYNHCPKTATIRKQERIEMRRYLQDYG